jgi:hypothetical protein
MRNESYLKVEVSVEHFGAVRALESLYSAMNLDVFVQVGSLRKAELAVRERALVGPFVCVDPEVVEKVMPLSEVLPAIFVVTLQNFDISL